MRPTFYLLLIVALLLQVQLWLSDSGYRKTHNLRVAVSEQRQQNDGLRERNAALDAEVVNLKNGREAARRACPHGPRHDRRARNLLPGRAGTRARQALT
ncbi:MAG: septum formation initiator family protein [Woeseiaceae bacterium]|nr:septum formation initiator family protein [Woeseiaceae bacterium]